MNAAATRVYALAPRFVFDHWSRDLPEDQTAVSRKERETGSRVYVELDAIGYEELLSDATYYSTEMGSGGFDDRGLISSARAVAAALTKAGPPPVEHEHVYDDWDPRLVLGPYERRYCACGAFQARKFQP